MSQAPQEKMVRVRILSPHCLLSNIHSSFSLLQQLIAMVQKGI